MGQQITANEHGFGPFPGDSLKERRIARDSAMKVRDKIHERHKAMIKENGPGDNAASGASAHFIFRELMKLAGEK